MNRRQFIRITLLGMAATLPIPKFLETKTLETGYGVWTAPETGTYSVSAQGGGVLTQQMIEDAAIKAIANHGKPESIGFVDEESFVALRKHFLGGALTIERLYK